MIDGIMCPIQMPGTKLINPEIFRFPIFPPFFQSTPIFPLWLMSIMISERQTFYLFDLWWHEQIIETSGRFSLRSTYTLKTQVAPPLFFTKTGKSYILPYNLPSPRFSTIKSLWRKKFTPSWVLFSREDGGHHELL